MASSILTIAGSGPSIVGWPSADICTKKRPVEAEYIVYPRGHWRLDKHPPQRVIWTEYPNKSIWERQYQQLLTKNGFGVAKMSNGLQAICVGIDIYSPDEIGLIGFDSFLDGSKKSHCWKAERRFARSLVNIVDLR